LQNTLPAIEDISYLTVVLGLQRIAHGQTSITTSYEIALLLVKPKGTG
jgi:hypothetical protein